MDFVFFCSTHLHNTFLWHGVQQSFFYLWMMSQVLLWESVEEGMKFCKRANR